MRYVIRLVLIVALFSLPASAQTRSDFTIPLDGKVVLDATIYVPTGTPPAKGFPAILFVHGFGLNKDWDTSDCSMYVGRGYVTMCYSVRGHGTSTGLSSIMSTPERNDLRKVLSCLRRFPHVNPVAIGIVGGSQGGLHGMWAAADRLPVNAITTDVIVPSWASDMFQNGSIRRTFCLLLRTANVRYDPQRDHFWELLRKDEYDSLRIQFPRHRDVNLQQLNSARTPMLRFLKWQDHYFGAANGIHTFGGYAGKKKLYIGTGGHYSDQSPGESQIQYDLVTRWLGKFLRHDSTGLLTQPLIQFAYSSLPMDSLGAFNWRRENAASWPPPGIRRLRLFPGAGAVLASVPSRQSSDTLSLNNLYLKPWYTFDTAFVEGFRGPRFAFALPTTTLTFTSPELESDLLWIGQPEMKLNVQADAETFPLHAQVYEVDKEGREYFINRINYTARHWKPGKKGVVRASGTAHAHMFRQGNRVRLKLTNVDVTNRNALGSYPFVLPVFRSCNLRIYLGGRSPSYLDLPVTSAFSSHLKKGKHPGG